MWKCDWSPMSEYFVVVMAICISVNNTAFLNQQSGVETWYIVHLAPFLYTPILQYITVKYSKSARLIGLQNPGIYEVACMDLFWQSCVETWSIVVPFLYTSILQIYYCKVLKISLFDWSSNLGIIEVACMELFSDLYGVQHW